jgi:putative tryptophan/tyrosine transport system substrate-binding protein
MTTRRGCLLALAAAAWVPSRPAFAQPRPRKVARVGVLGATTAAGYATRWDAMRTGLRDLGYVEGTSLAIEHRWADGRNDVLPRLANELVGLDVDVIVTHGIPATRAAQQATTRIPIVMAIVTDPVAAGLVASFARPGGNTTGSAWFAPELAAKRLGVLKEASPRLAQVAVLVNPGNPAFVSAMLQAMQPTAAAAGIRLRPFDARGQGEFEGAFAAMAQGRAEAVVVLEEAVLNSYPAEIAGLARKHRLPSIGNKELAEAGGLIGYGPDLHRMFYRAAYFVDRILKGAAAGELPIEQASQFELVLNRGTASAIGFALPQSLAVRADRVID